MTERLINARDRSVVVGSIRWARTWWARARGLIGHPALQDGEALVIVPGAQVHTFFMAGPIDVLFCDREWMVLRVVSPLARRRVSRWVKGARFVIELPPGSAAAVRAGDRLVLEGQDPSVR